MKTKTKTTKAKKAPPKPVHVPRTPMDIGIDRLVHAPWNPRAEITAESVADITASILTNGLIQRLVVIPADGDGYVVVAGNRRLEACRAAGMTTVPCELLDVDEEHAKRLTFIENLQRRNVNPVLEARLIGELIDSGMTVDAIAAEIGASHGFVVRRAQLRSLTDKWRERALDGVTAFRVDCLEKVARYAPATQDAVYEQMFGEGGRYDGEADEDEGAPTVAWGDVSYAFDRATRSLSGAKFDTEACRRCAHNTACQRSLFEEYDDYDGEGAGDCMDGECYRRKVEEWRKAQVEALGPDAVEAARGWAGMPSNEYGVPYSREPDETHTTPYWYWASETYLVVEWYDPRELERRERLRAKAKAEQKAEQARAKAREAVAEKVRLWWRDNGAREVLKTLAPLTTVPSRAMWLVGIATALQGRTDHMLRNRVRLMAEGVLTAGGKAYAPFEDDVDFAGELVKLTASGASFDYGTARLVLEAFAPADLLTDDERKLLNGGAE